MINKLRTVLRKVIGFVQSTRGESIRYLIIGGCTTLVNFALFAVMTKILRVEVTLSNITSISVSILFAYITNKRFVFRNRCSKSINLVFEFIKFVGSRLITMAVEVGGVLLFVSILGQDSLVGKIETQILVITGNYLISKFIVFKKQPDAQI
jgi:putative flippase GtrA